MAGNDEFFEALKEFDGVWESLGRNRNHPNDDDDWHSTPETRDHEIQINSSLDLDGNFSASNFSRETRVAFNRSTEFSIQGFSSSFNISTSDSLACAGRSSSEATEENPTNSFLPPVETASVDFGRAEENQSNPSELSSNQQNIARNGRRPVQKKRPRNASLRGEDNTFSEKGNEPAEFSLLKKPNPPISEWLPRMSVERDGKEGTAQTEDCIEWSSAYATFTPFDNISSLGKATDRVSPGSVAGAEAVPIAGSSGIRTQGHRTGKEKLFKCGVCQKTFGRKCNLDDHNRTHTGKKPFECNLCEKRFAQQSNLTKHRRKHTGEKPFECDFCGKRFAEQSNLTRHLRIHTGEKPFECDICGKRLAQKKYLVNHLRIHSGEKPFNCDICGNKFARKHHLSDHLRTHSGEKRFKCEFCDERFAHQGSCIRHQKRKHSRM